MRSCAGLWLEALAETPTVIAGRHAADHDHRHRPHAGPAHARPRRAALRRARLVRAPGGARGPARTRGRGRPDRAATLPRPPTACRARSSPSSRPWPWRASILPADLPSTQPCWLRERPLQGSFEIADPRLVGEAGGCAGARGPRDRGLRRRARHLRRAGRLQVDGPRLRRPLPLDSRCCRPSPAGSTRAPTCSPTRGRARCASRSRARARRSRAWRACGFPRAGAPRPPRRR